MTYSLVLHALEPKPTRQELEEITVGVPGISRVDAAAMANDWFGIVAKGLHEEDARAFQSNLRGKGIASEVVADFDIPALHPDFRCQRIDLDGDSITLTTAMNRRQVRGRAELVFVAAGFVDKDKLVTKSELHFETRSADGSRYNGLVERNVRSFEEKNFFRVDLFFASEPHRVSLEIEKDTVMFHGDRHLRLKSLTELTVLMLDLQALIPPERMNRGLRELSRETLYPTMHAYEEELRWEFHRLGAKG